MPYRNVIPFGAIRAFTVIWMVAILSGRQLMSDEPNRAFMTVAGESGSVIQTSADPSANAQPSQVEQAWTYLQKSMEATPRIQEHLVGEQELLWGLQTRLAAELVVIPKPEGEWAEDAATWIEYAYICERQGDSKESIAALYQALPLVKLLAGEQFSIVKTMQLLSITEGFGRQKDYAGALESALAIDTTEDSAITVTEAGFIDLPQAAAQSYALMLVSFFQSANAEYQSARNTANQIQEKFARSAAHWLIALQQTKNGNLDEAALSAKAAIKHEGLRLPWAEPAQVAEYSAKGPKLVPLTVYRTIVLSQLAIGHCMTGDEQSAKKSIDRIGDLVMRDAAIVELMSALVANDKSEMADAWLKEIRSAEIRSIALFEIGKLSLAGHAYDIADRNANAIEHPAWETKLRLEICKALAKAQMRDDLDKQIERLQTAITSISQPLQRTQALVQFSMLLAKSGKQARARDLLSNATQQIKNSPPELNTQVLVLADIAAALEKAAATQAAHELFATALEISQELDDYSKPSARLAVLKKMLEAFGANEETALLANSNASAPERVEALISLARVYLEQGQVDQGRMMYKSAFDAALEIMDFMGLDTRYSKGGAMRYIAQEQGQTDLAGLVQFLETSDNQNVVAYGYLGAAESLVPDQSVLAENRGSIFPNGISNSLWNELRMSTFVESN